MENQSFTVDVEVLLSFKQRMQCAILDAKTVEDIKVILYEFLDMMISIDETVGRHHHQYIEDITMPEER